MQVVYRWFGAGHVNSNSALQSKDYTKLKNIYTFITCKFRCL